MAMKGEAAERIGMQSVLLRASTLRQTQATTNPRH